MPQITFAPTFEPWQRAARRALQQGIPPGEIEWQELESAQPALGLFEEMEDAPPANGAVFRVPKEFLPLARKASFHRDERRWALLYRLLWRLTHGEPKLLQIASDPDVIALLPELKARGVRTALDLGCGVGRHALLLAEHGLAVEAIDGAAAGLAVVPITGRAAGWWRATPPCRCSFSGPIRCRVFRWWAGRHGSIRRVTTSKPNPRATPTRSGCG